VIRTSVLLKVLCMHEVVEFQDRLQQCSNVTDHNEVYYYMYLTLNSMAGRKHTGQAWVWLGVWCEPNGCKGAGRTIFRGCSCCGVTACSTCHCSCVKKVSKCGPGFRCKNYSNSLGSNVAIVPQVHSNTALYSCLKQSRRNCFKMSCSAGGSMGRSG